MLTCERVYFLGTLNSIKVKSNIFVFAHDDANKRGWSMPATLNKPDCGIKSDATAQFFLPLADRDKYIKDPVT